MPRDDRHRYGDGQDAGQSARGADQPSDGTGRHLVSVPDRRHGDDGPPERVRDAVDRGTVDLELGVVDGARVEHHTRAQSDDEDAEALQTGSNRCYQYLSQAIIITVIIIIIIISFSTLYRHIKITQQRTVIQQYGDWYTGR